MAQSMIKQRYRLRAQIGAGGFATVFEAEDTELDNRLVAVKRIDPQGLSARDLQEASVAFRHETEILVHLVHPNLPAIYDTFTDGSSWYLVMQLLEGETLQEYGQRMRCQVEEACLLGIQICSVLDYLHTRQPPIIFRDLKPSNLMLVAGGHLYVIDFGIARYFKPGQAKDTIALGSPGYAAPEQYSKAQSSPQTDLFGLGATLYYLLTGDDPADQPFVFPLLAQIPGPMQDLLRRLLAMDAGKRPENALAVKVELEAILAGEASPVVGSAPTSAVFPAPRVVTYAAVGEMLSTYRVPQGFPRYMQVCWSPDGKLIASTTCSDTTVHIWEAESGRPVMIYKGRVRSLGDNSMSTCLVPVCWSPDGRYLAVADDQIITVWDVAAERPLLFYRLHHRNVVRLAWCPVGDLVASCGTDGETHVWHAMNGGIRYMLPSPDSYSSLNGYTWSPDGTRLAIAARERVLVVDGQTGRLELVCERGWTTTPGGHPALTGPGFSDANAAWSPDGKYLISGVDRRGTSPTRVGVWDARTGDAVALHAADLFEVNAVAWSPNPRYAAWGGSMLLGSREVTVPVWDMPASRKAHAFRYPLEGIGEVTDLQWSPDGSLLASGDADGVVRVFRAPF